MMKRMPQESRQWRFPTKIFHSHSIYSQTCVQRNSDTRRKLEINEKNIDKRDARSIFKTLCEISSWISTQSSQSQHF